MNNNNFGKDIRNLTENELFFHINNHDPKFGVLCLYELNRRLTLENAKSSEKNSKASFYLSIVAILISIGIGAVQIYLASL